MNGLTPREREVIYVIRSGRRSTIAIARALDPPVSPRTAEAHVYAIAEKLPGSFEPATNPLLRVILYALLDPENPE